jgi:hypothetical protein
MDSWTDAQLKKMKEGGNRQCCEFLSKHGVDLLRSSTREKYDSPAAELYRQVLKARIENRPEPTELPAPPKEHTVAQNKNDKEQMTGFGSGPHPNELKKRKRKKIGLGLGVSSAKAFLAWVTPSSKRNKLYPPSSRSVVQAS